MGEENGTAASFMSFCTLMVDTGWLVHDEFFIMDNAAVHTGGEARGLEEWFWDKIIDGRALHVLVLPESSSWAEALEFPYSAKLQVLGKSCSQL
jgi:hypothetical protein